MSKVSVIIVTYNAAPTLQACLNSIFNQAYPYIEIVVMDGQSTDGTVAILQQNSNRIAFWKSEKDNGVYHAMNKALDHITGDWVYFIGADDELLPAFSTMLAELTDPSVIYYGNVLAENEIKLGELTRTRLAKVGIYHQAMIYPKSVFDKYRYDARYKISADFALTLKLCGDAGYRFQYKNYVIANFNHTGISGLNIDVPFQRDKAGLIFKNFGLKTWSKYRWHKLKNRHNPRA